MRKLISIFCFVVLINTLNGHSSGVDSKIIKTQQNDFYLPQFHLPGKTIDNAVAAFKSSLLKNGSSDVLLTDSVITFNQYSGVDSLEYHKIQYEYNKYNELSAIIYQKFDNGQWSDYQKSEFQYKDALNQALFTLKIMDDDSGGWHNHTKREYNYINSGNVSSVAEYIYDVESENWKGNWRYDYQFEGDNITQKTASTWDDIMFKWKWATKEEFELINGHVVQNVRSVRNQDQQVWVGDQKNEYTLNSNGEIEEQITFFWETGKGRWVKSMKKEFEITANGEVSRWAAFRWDRNHEKWIDWWQVEKSRDGDNNLTLWQDAGYNPESEEWVNGWQVEKAYTPANNLKSESINVWDRDLGGWVGSIRTDYAYSDDNQLQVVEDYDWDEALNQWQVNQKRFHYASSPDYAELLFTVLDDKDEELYHAQISVDGDVYPHGEYFLQGILKGERSIVVTAAGFIPSAFVMDVAAFNEKVVTLSGVGDYVYTGGENCSVLKIHPNPVSGQLHINSPKEISRIKVFSPNGSLLKQVNPNSNNSVIYMGDLPAGFYMIETETGSTVKYNKVIVK